MSIRGNFNDYKKLFTLGNLCEMSLSKRQSNRDNTSQKEAMQRKQPDDILVEASKRGEMHAFEMLVLRYQRQIFGLIYQMTHDAEVVEDIGQDVFVAAFKAIKSFQSKSSFFTWLYRIAINHCKNYLASSNRVQKVEHRYRKEQQTGGRLGNEGHTPQSLLLEKEFVEHIEEAIIALPEEQRVVLTLCEFEGLSYQEISEILECPIGTVRSRLSRARTALQERLRDYL